jgi:hypothetical protein
VVPGDSKNREEKSKGSQSPEDALFNGLVDEEIVGMVRFEWHEIPTSNRASEQIGISKHVRSITNQRPHPRKTEVVEPKPWTFHD